ncbi:uncharacterized protein LOC134850902 [Symsagittifera roscoffensis]|uniref:uncharacterized protein LOC134850902 n=1 Tax=Symsagittifera roscoffensis TaxID=84072 RepID=UPI00307C01D3
MVLFGVPIVGYLALPAILLYPKKVLARPFLTTVMRKEFDLEKHQLRKTGFKPSLIALCEALEEEATADNDGKLRTICSAANKKIDPCDVVEETLPLFESDRLSFNYLDRYELIDLATCCGIRKSHLLPSFVLVYWIDKRVQALQSLAHALQKDIVPLTTLNKAIRHDVEAALFELLHDRTDDRDNLEVSASRMHHFWNIMKNCDKLPNASKRYAFLHGLIYLAAKQNES